MFKSQKDIWQRNARKQKWGRRAQQLRLWSRPAPYVLLMGGAFWIFMNDSSKLGRTFDVAIGGVAGINAIREVRKARKASNDQLNYN